MEGKWEGGTKNLKAVRDWYEQGVPNYQRTHAHSFCLFQNEFYVSANRILFCQNKI